jgi:hypothetical protein
MDYEKLTKLMMMTTSHHDGEALVALRMANKILEKEKKNWSEVLNGKHQKQQHYTYQQPKAYKPKDDITQNMFDLLNKDVRLSASTKQFINDLSIKYGIWGALTPKQQAAVEKIFYRYYSKA